MNRICACCGNTEISGTSDEEMLKEQHKLFPGLSEEDRAIVCYDCFIQIMDFNEPGRKRYEKLEVANE